MSKAEFLLLWFLVACATAPLFGVMIRHMRGEEDEDE